MTAKEYLSQAHRLDQRIDAKIAQVASLNDLATKCSATLTGMPRNPNHGSSTMADAVCKIIDLQDEINRDIDQLVDMQAEAYELLYKISNQEYYDVLEMHYMQYMTFEQIGAKKGCSRRWAEKLHGRALEVFGKILKAQE